MCGKMCVLMTHFFVLTKDGENVKNRMHVYMGAEMQAQVRQAAKDSGLSQSQIICWAVKRFFDQSEVTFELNPQHKKDGEQNDNE